MDALYLKIKKGYSLAMELTLGARLKQLHAPILITGHTGFKGTWLTLLLEQLEIPTIGLSLPPLPESLYLRCGREGKIEEEFLDIRDYEKVLSFISAVRPSAVIHLAAQPLVLESYRSPRSTFETNVMGTVNILDSCSKILGLRALIVATTDKVYRNDNTGQAFVESDALQGKDPYSSSKVAAESAVNAWQRISHFEGGPKIMSVRAGNVIGGGDWAENRLIPDLVRGFSANQKVRIRNPESSRPWQHVLDPLHGYVSALESMLLDSSAETLNFSPRGKNLTVREVVKIAAQAWNQPTEIQFDEIPEMKNQEAISLNLDSSQANKSLNWSPFWSQEFAVESSMKWWLSYYKNHTPAHDLCLDDIQLILESAAK
jgi:CDP-glucose 4,6-dehydratase